MLTNPAPLGYALYELLPSGDVNSIWSQLPNAVDGIGGGSYALVAPLSITGQLITLTDLTVTDDLNVGDALDVGGSAAVAVDLDVGQDATVVGTLAAALVAATAVITDDITVVDDASVGGDISVSGFAKFSFKSRMGTDTAEVLTPADSCQVIFSEALTTNRTWTTSGSFVAGQWIWIYNQSGPARDLTFLGVTLGNGEGILVVWSGANWRVFVNQ